MSWSLCFPVHQSERVFGLISLLLIFLLMWSFFPFHLLLCDSPGLTGSGPSLLERTPHLSLNHVLHHLRILRCHSWFLNAVPLLAQMHFSRSVKKQCNFFWPPLYWCSLIVTFPIASLYDSSYAALHITLVLKKWNKYTSLLTFNKCVKHLGPLPSLLNISTGMEIRTSGFLYTLHSCPHFLLTNPLHFLIHKLSSNLSSVLSQFPQLGAPQRTPSIFSTHCLHSLVRPQ